MKNLAKFYFAIFFLIFSYNGFSKGITLVKDSSKIKEANRKKMIELQKKFDSVQVGKIAPDFKYVNNKGDSVQFSYFKGKIIVIDFWATWCPPCVAQFPFYDSLKIKFAGKDIVFMSISIDHPKSRWEKHMKKKKYSGIQLWSGPTGVAYYYTLMDRKIMERADPISANSEEAKKTFNSGVSIFDGVPGNFVIIAQDGKIEGNWLLPSDGHVMENKLNELLTRAKK